MADYIFGVRNGIHVIDLYKTIQKVEEAGTALRQIAKSAKKILFVGTKKQAQEAVAKHIQPLGMPFVVERWSGGMLTNFATIRRSIKKMQALDKMLRDGTVDTLSKRERLQIQRQKDKMEKLFGSITEMSRVPSAIFVIDLKKEHIAVAEAKRLGIPVFGLADTNVNPNTIDFPIPANDDAASSIDKILSIIAEYIQEGLNERKAAGLKEENPAVTEEKVVTADAEKVLRPRRKKAEDTPKA